MAYSAQQMKNHRKKLKEEGLCIRCGVKEASKGKLMCSDCAIVRSRQNRAFRLHRDYHLSIEEYQRMFIEQKGVCAICNKSSPKKLLAVDHDPILGVRSLLCMNCNVGLGYFKHNPQLLRGAADYIDNWEKLLS